MHSNNSDGVPDLVLRKFILFCSRRGATHPVAVCGKKKSYYTDPHFLKADTRIIRCILLNKENPSRALRKKTKDPKFPKLF